MVLLLLTVHFFSALCLPTDAWVEGSAKKVGAIVTAPSERLAKERVRGFICELLLRMYLAECGAKVRLDVATPFCSATRRRWVAKKSPLLTCR